MVGDILVTMVYYFIMYFISFYCYLGAKSKEDLQRGENYDVFLFLKRSNSLKFIYKVVHAD